MLIVGLALLATGVTPWVAPVAVALCLTLAIGQRTSWPFALAAAVIVELALIALIVRFTPSMGIGLVAGATIVLGVVGLTGLIAFTLQPDPRVVGVRVLRIGLPIIVIPFALVIVVAVQGIATGELEWAMHNDAVWNLVTTRIMVEDGGLDAISHPNASPLTPGLLAVAIAVGREGVPPSELLAHDVGRVAVFWLLAALGGALLAALVGARSVRGGTRAARITGAGIAALVPLSWFTFGFAAQYGFYNATVTMLLLLAAWLAWLEARVAPVAAAAVLSLAAVALLATWAPLAIAPFALACAALVSRLSALKGQRSGWWGYVVLILAVLPVPLYVVAVTLPDLRRDGAALAVDGGIMPLGSTHVLVIAMVTLLVAVFGAIHRNQGHQLNGVLVVLASGALGGAYLVAQRANAGAPLWGYYPAKFAWLLVSLLLVILAAAIAGEMASVRGRRLATAGIAAVAAAVPASLMLLVPPSSDRVVSLLTPVAIATNKGVASGSPAAQNLFQLAEPGERTIVADYLGPSHDRFINSWLLQLESTSAQDPIRTYSYFLDPQNPAQVCEAAAVWAGPVRIVTSVPAMADALGETCGGADVDIVVRDPAAGVHLDSVS
jgi:4-amino-4-deoxy-L-arabinose transferase-like glycosyltransferase